jgi:hypothetical protein
MLATVPALFFSFGASPVDFASLFAVALFWGLGDAVFNTQISALLGICYPEDPVSVMNLQV